MKNYITLLIFLMTVISVSGQNIDDSFSYKKMQKDLSLFKEIRARANSGLYKYRSKKQIDSIYKWAENKIKTAATHRDFYNIICKLTDYEGSLHNDTSLPKKTQEKLEKENYGYFPLPIKWIQGKWVINYKNKEIPLGSEITAINDIPISKIIKNLYKYYTTDGLNITGKRTGIRKHFSKYYRLHYGQVNTFNIVYKDKNTALSKTISIEGISYNSYYKRFTNRHSKPYDNLYYLDLDTSQKYHYKDLDTQTGLLTINTFSMGNETTEEHKAYKEFLDSVFTKIKMTGIENLIIDVRQNSGGSDPNDVITYSYVAARNFQESRQAWIAFNKIPLIRHLDINVPKTLRPFGVGRFNRHFQQRFPVEKNGNFYLSKESSEMKKKMPHKNAFKGTIYLLVSPEVASAGSLFAAMVASNANSIVIGEETMGGYYGHNGHTSLSYVLPKSGIITDFSIDNIEQDVSQRENQLDKRGIIPDYIVPQNFKDFIKNIDTQMRFTLDLIQENQTNH